MLINGQTLADKVKSGPSFELYMKIYDWHAIAMQKYQYGLT